jgi:hypothetical protein
MTNTIDDREQIELALSLGVNPETGEKLTEEERAVLQAMIAESDERKQDAAEAVSLNRPENPEGGDLAALVQAEIAKVLGNTTPQQQLSFEDVLKQIDPRDSDSALLMLDWLQKTGRLQNIGSINGGGYIWHYGEPKGTSKQGYVPGATKGGRMVDQAVDTARASGAKPRQTGICDKCWSGVEKQDDGSIALDGDPTAKTCTDGQPHTFNA